MEMIISHVWLFMVISHAKIIADSALFFKCYFGVFIEQLRSTLEINFIFQNIHVLFGTIIEYQAIYLTTAC